MRKFTIISLSTLLATISFGALAQEQPRRPPPPPPPTGNNPNQVLSSEEVEQRLQSLIAERSLEPILVNSTTLPSITGEVAQLGKKLFFTKSLGGEQSVACASCHHPALGGGDQLSLSVGVDAVDELDNTNHDLLGHGRFNGNHLSNQPVVPRNAPTIFNLGLFNDKLFWDGRVERSRNGGIITPDSDRNTDNRRRSDRTLPEGTTLAAAQSRFPVTSADEMRGSFLAAQDGQQLRAALTARLNNQLEDIAGNWANEFSLAFGDSTISEERLFHALGEYQRSMQFVNNPWNNYLSGDNDALTESEKRGAILFFSARNEGGAGCAGCHSGPNFSNERHHFTAFPQIGIGKGNESITGNSQDFGRENVTLNIEDRYHFRTPTLLNIEVTAPYGHTGAYATLEEVIRHYDNPRVAINRLFASNGLTPFSTGQAPYCQLPQIVDLVIKNGIGCEAVFADVYERSIEVVTHLEQANAGIVPSRAPLRPRRPLNEEQVSQLAAFLRALTDPCVQDRNCLAPWIIDGNDIATFPDSNIQVAKDRNGTEL